MYVVYSMHQTYRVVAVGEVVDIGDESLVSGANVEADGGVCTVQSAHLPKRKNKTKQGQKTKTKREKKREKYGGKKNVGTTKNKRIGWMDAPRRNHVKKTKHKKERNEKRKNRKGS